MSDPVTPGYFTERRGGRPELIIDPFTLVIFFAHQGICFHQAEDEFGLTRRAMEKSLDCYAKLMEDTLPLTLQSQAYSEDGT